MDIKSGGKPPFPTTNLLRDMLDLNRRGQAHLPHNTHHESLVTNNLYREAVAPTVLFPRKSLSGLPDRFVAITVQHPSGSSETLISYTNLHAGVALDVLHPLRGVEMLGKNVELAF